MDLNLAPLPLGFGATSVWGWRGARFKLGFGLDFPWRRIGADFGREDGLASDDHLGSAGC
jgi:hypothetical protein